MIDPRRQARYQRIHDQLKELIQDKSPNLISAMATIVAVLHHKMPHHFWTGFYFTGNDNELHVGPYQGTLACQVLKDKGVCLHSVNTRAPVVVPDVEAFPGHIACDARSKSEIVLPVIKEGEVVAVLDIDSEQPARFDEDDVRPLEGILSLLTPFI
ncbi:MAG: GAF domain-containing protein [Desulfobacterales bacterium]|nr:GAF domain-containing protein [Desulfobacterales bacterium]